MLPSLWPYLQRLNGDENFLALAVFIYSLGEFVGSIVWGYVYNSTSMKFSLLSWIFTGFAGSAVYSLGGYFPNFGKWLIILGRMLQGIWTGAQQTVNQAYISEWVDQSKNLDLIVNLGASVVIGFTVGPIVGLAAKYTNFTIGWFYVDEYTSAGYYQSIITLIMIAIVANLFEEIPRKYRRSLSRDNKDDFVLDGSISAKEILKNNKNISWYIPSRVDFSKLTEDEKYKLSRLKPNTKVVLLVLIISIISFNGFAVQETTTTPISTDINHKYTNTLDNGKEFAYILFACSGILSISTFILLKIIKNLISNNILLLISTFLGFIGYIITIDYSPRVIEPVRFVVGFCLISVAFPFSRSIIVSLYAKIIGKHKAGVYVGYMMAAGAVTRCVGPFWAVQTLIVSPTITYGICAVLFGISILIQVFYFKNICPHWSFYIEGNEKQSKINQNTNSLIMNKDDESKI